MEDGASTPPTKGRGAAPILVGLGILVVVLVVAGAVLVGRRSESPRGDDNSPGGRIAGGAGPMSSLIASVPNTPELANVPLYLNDYVAASDAYGLKIPTIEDSTTTWKPYLDALTTGSAGAYPSTRGGFDCIECASSPNFGRYWQSALGWSPGDITRDVVAGSLPGELTVLQGHFDVASIDAAFRTDRLTGPRFKTEDDNGTTIFTSTCQELDNKCYGRGRTLKDNIGYPLQLAPTATAIPISLNLAAVRGSVDVQSGRVASLAGNSVIAPLAIALDQEHAYSGAILGAKPELLSIAKYNEVTSGTTEPKSNLTGLSRYTSMAVGVRRDAGAKLPTMIIIVLNPDDATAQANVDKLKGFFDTSLDPRTAQPLNKRFEAGTIKASGPLTIGAFPIKEGPQTWAQLVVKRIFPLPLGN